MKTGRRQAAKGRFSAPVVVAGAAVLLAIVMVSAAMVVRWKSSQTVGTAQPMLSAVARAAASMDPLDLVLTNPGERKITLETLTIEKVWIDTCERSRPSRVPSEPCDRQPAFERALIRAVARGAECMPEKPKEESISFALEVNYAKKTTRLFAGRSGSISGAQAKPILACVKGHLVEPDWDSSPHNHNRYVIGVLARYPAQKRQ